MNEPLQLPIRRQTDYLARFNEWLDSKPAPNAAFTRRTEMMTWVQARCLEAFRAGYDHADNYRPFAEIDAEVRRAQRRAFVLGVVAAVGFGLVVALFVFAL